MDRHRLGCRLPVRAVNVLGSQSWLEALTAEPAKTAAALLGLAVVTAGAGAGLRLVARRTPALQNQVLFVVLAGLAIGAAAAAALSWLMVLDPGELTNVIGVLAITAVVATVLILVATKPLRADLDRLEHTVRRIEDGDRDARATIDRVDELGHVGRALDDLNERLDELERERAGFEAERTAMLSSVSHDLRTPLAALRVAVEALVDGIATDPPRYLRSMQRDIDALSSLVDDLFLLVRLENGRYEIQPSTVDLTEVADEAVEALAPVAAARNVHLALAAERRVKAQGSAAALGRVIRNLIDNAIRFAPDGSTVTVEVRDDTDPCVRIVDDGPGFPESFAATAFDRFTRADPSRSRSTGGTGLGLAIARGLVEAHGGRIWIEQAPGGRIAFALPTT
jgi:signal transduction histidine kinase